MKNNCNCKKKSRFCTCNEFCEDSQDLETSLQSILESESSISECAAKLFSSIFPCELDSLDDIQKKINLFTQLLLAYNNRACSLGKLIESIGDIEDTYVPNPHIDVFDCKVDNYEKPTPPTCTDSIIDKIKNSLSSINCCKPDPCYKEAPCYVPDPSCCEPIKNSSAKPICNGLYFLDKVRIYYKCNSAYIVYDIYFNSNTCSLVFCKSKNQCTYNHTYVIN